MRLFYYLIGPSLGVISSNVSHNLFVGLIVASITSVLLVFVDKKFGENAF